MSFLQTFSGSGVGGAITAIFTDGFEIWEKIRLNFNTLNAKFYNGNGSPEGTVTAVVSSMYFQEDAAAGSSPLWTKRSGTGNTGWVSLVVGPTSQFTPLRSVVMLTNDQIKALPSTPMKLVSAPGTGLRLKLLAAPTLHLLNASGVYGNVNSIYAALAVQWRDGTWAATPLVNDNSMFTPLTDVTTFFTTVSDGLGWIVEMSAPYSEAVDAGATSGSSEWGSNFLQGVTQNGGVQGENKDLILSLDNNGGGNLTDGDNANSLKVTVYYTVEEL